MNTINRLALLSFVCAIITIGLAVKYDANVHLLRFAASLAALAYFLILLDNYVRSAPLPMRSGSLSKAESPLRYRLAYLFMVFMGLVFLLVTWTP